MIIQHGMSSILQQNYFDLLSTIVIISLSIHYQNTINYAPLLHGFFDTIGIFM
jgi:hypothetical protein